MAGNTTNVSIRMDTELKARADALFSELGMNLTTAFNIFVRQSLREGGIPFKITIEQPNKETIAAMLEAKRIAKDPSEKGYSDLDELFDDLKRWKKTNIPSNTQTVSKKIAKFMKNVATRSLNLT